MLVITRKTSESFFVGDNITVTILEVNGDKVKIGIDAPKSVKIIRKEVLETINNNIEAVSTVTLKDLELLKQTVIKK